MMTLFDFLISSGVVLKKVARTNGGEYAGPCPWCGGKDRFRVWPNKGDNGRYWCRQCGRSGDTIQFLRDYKGMSFAEAKAAVGGSNTVYIPTRPTKSTVEQKHKPTVKASTIDYNKWQRKAEAFILSCQAIPDAQLEYLTKQRLLKPETIQKYKLGYNPRWKLEPPENWGLPADKKISIAPGIVIPVFDFAGRIVRVKIRTGGNPKYLSIAGSKQIPYVTGNKEANIVIIVEAELDAILLAQELPEMCVIGLGSANTRPDKELIRFLNSKDIILVALDDDNAGAKEAWNYWLEMFSQAFRLPPIKAKDPTEMLASGVDLREWVEAGIYLARGKERLKTSEHSPTITEPQKANQETKKEHKPEPEHIASTHIASTPDEAICLICKHYKADWNRPLYLKGKDKPISRGVCELHNRRVRETESCNQWEAFLTPLQNEPFQVRILAIRSTAPDKPINWPADQVKMVQKEVDSRGGLSAAIEVINFHEGNVAWFVHCKALGKSAVWLYHENDQVLNQKEKAHGYVINGDKLKYAGWK